MDSQAVFHFETVAAASVKGVWCADEWHIQTVGMPKRKRARARERPRDAIGSAVHIGRIAVGELPNDTLPEERMQASLLTEAQAII